jgi:hypothetical protein
LEVGLRVGKVAINSNPADHATVEILGHTFEFIVDNDTPGSGHIGVQRGVHQNAAAAAGRITIIQDPTYSTGVFVLGGKTYTLAYVDPEDSTFWISWSNFISVADGISAIAAAINSNDGINYTATTGGPDENDHYYVSIVADATGTAWNGGNTNHCDLSFPGMSGGLDDQVNIDSPAVVALALATAISGHTPEFIEAAIDPAHTNEVILISLE